MTTQRSARLLAFAFALACVAPRAAGAQGLTDTRWMPWLGCWAPVAVQAANPAVDEPVGVPLASAPQAAALLCVSPAPDGAGIVVATVRDGQEIARRTIIADGVEREVELEGCRGVESARWSQDDGRVFYRTSYTCEGDIERRSSGATLMLPNGQWLDAEVVHAGGARELEVRRYRFATDEEYRAHGRKPPEGNALALETARRAAAATFSVNDVIEATDAVDEEVVQALLVDYGGRFPLDAEALERLADAGVSGETIDLMVALSYPDRFEVDRGALAAAFRAPVPAVDTTGVLALGPYANAALTSGGRYGNRSFWPSWWTGPFGYDPLLGYRFRFGYPTSWGDPYYWPYSRRWVAPGIEGPIIVVERKPDAGGRAVAGGGYKRTNPGESRGKAVPRAGASMPDWGRSSSVAPASSSSGRATSGGGYKAGDTGSSADTGGRKAKPRGSE